MKDPVRVLVVDDEAPARAALRRMLSEDPEVDVVGCCGDGKQALLALKALAPEVLFLDVRMPGLDGFQVVQAAGPRPPKVVFVTAHAGRALEAFDAEAVDYVLKPFDDDRFARALGRAKAAARADRARPANGSAAGREAPRYLERIAVPDRDGIRIVPIEEIDWIEAQDYYVEVHSAGRGYLLRRSLRQLEERLDPRRFARIHRSAIVNVARIQSMRPATHGERDLVLRDGTQLKLSRMYRDRLAGLL
ncbi:MAG TPA: LytTR family DNA-binding domain-containing protein [Myxococcales bacterium]|nr:LytTR family DNA-binding domain-containing protein [Myxococcales bacterium]